MWGLDGVWEKNFKSCEAGVGMATKSLVQIEMEPLGTSCLHQH